MQWTISVKARYRKPDAKDARTLELRLTLHAVVPKGNNENNLPMKI
jgi:hypothetical protein